MCGYYLEFKYSDKYMAEFIRIYDSAISDDMCDRLMSEIDENAHLGDKADEPWRRCLMLSYPHGSIDGSGEMFDQLKMKFRELFQLFKSDIGQAGGSGTLNFCSLIEKPNIILYVPNETKQEMFHDHSDNWSQDSSTRQVSLILYLNDVDDGGCTVFPYYDISVKPKKGTVLMFPSFYTYTHHAEAPKSGPKYVVVSWIHFGSGTTKYISYEF